MVAASESYTIVEPITRAESLYGWYCETCKGQGRLIQINRRPEAMTTRFIVVCQGGAVTPVDMTDLFREQRPAVLAYRHQQESTAPRQDNAQLQLRCLSGCGEVATLTFGNDYQRDGRIITPHCQGPRLNIFVSEQTWRNGVKRISYRHDGNYVVFDNDMRVASEGRVGVPERLSDDDREHLAQAYARGMMNQNIRVTGTQTITHAFSYDPNSPVALSAYERRIQQQQEEADRQREEIWREFDAPAGGTLSPEEQVVRRIEQREQYRDELLYGPSIAELRRGQKHQSVKPEPRPARLVRRRALEKKEEK